MNYRLGAFGWLGGSKYVESGGTANIGLLDQAFAMKWVWDEVDKFGGDARREVIVSPCWASCVPLTD